MDKVLSELEHVADKETGMERPSKWTTQRWWFY